MESDNPAQRLLDILERAKKIPKERPCREGWKEILGTSNDAALLAKLGAVMGLPYQVLQAVEEHHPGTGKHHAHWVGQLSTAFGEQNLEGAWNTFRSRLSDQAISYVALAATSLAGRSTSRRLSEEELNSLREQVESLGSAILEADLPAQLQKYLLRQVRLLKAAIEDYWLSGGGPILDIVDATFGHIALQSEHREAMSTSTGRRVAAALAVVADTVTLANGLPPLLTSAGVPLLQWAKDYLTQ